MLSREQFACFRAMSDDVRALCPDRERTADVARSLLAALSNGSVDDWRVAVRGVDELVAACRPTTPAAVRRRLVQFVAENADLLADA